MSDKNVCSWLRQLDDIRVEPSQPSLQELLHHQHIYLQNHEQHWQEQQPDNINTNADAHRAPQLDAVRGRNRDGSVCSSSRESHGEDDSDASMSDTWSTSNESSLPSTPASYQMFYTLFDTGSFEMIPHTMLSDSMYVQASESLTTSLVIEPLVIPDEILLPNVFTSQNYLLDLQHTDRIIACAFDREPLLLNELSTSSVAPMAAKLCNCACRCK